jgi:hypothetical protein
VFRFPLEASKGRQLRLVFSFLVSLAVIAAVQQPAQAVDALHVNLIQTGQWRVSAVATNGPDNAFNGVDAVNPDDVWAVGGTNTFTSGLQNTLIEHWDGRRWTITKSPNATDVPSFGVTNFNVLNAVDAISSNDVWAVGYTGINGTGGSASLVEHWNGHAWSIVTSPNGVSPTFNFYNYLLGVSGTSANDVWAVGWNGFKLDPGVHRATTQHWDGTKWSLVPVPTVGNNAQNVVLQAVTAVAPNDAWAAGYFSDEGDGDVTPSTVTHPLTLHWDGTHWNIVNAADISLGATFNRVSLQAVKAISSNDIWAAGNVSYVASGVGQVQAVIEHWDGTRWSLVASPSPADTATTLTGFALFASNDIWAVGTRGAPFNKGARDPLLVHWDGLSWTIVTAPRPDNSYNCGFFGAAATSGGAEAVGACIAVDASTQPPAMPLAELFR